MRVLIRRASDPVRRCLRPAAPGLEPSGRVRSSARGTAALPRPVRTSRISCVRSRPSPASIPVQRPDSTVSTTPAPGQSPVDSSTDPRSRARADSFRRSASVRATSGPTTTTSTPSSSAATTVGASTPGPRHHRQPVERHPRLGRREQADGRLPDDGRPRPAGARVREHGQHQRRRPRDHRGAAAAQPLGQDRDQRRRDRHRRTLGGDDAGGRLLRRAASGSDER